MTKRINFLYMTDILGVLLGVAVLWTGVLFVLHEVLEISPDKAFKTIATTSGITVLSALSLTSFALVMHLRKNKVALYSEDILNSTKK